MTNKSTAIGLGYAFGSLAAWGIYAMLTKEIPEICLPILMLHLGFFQSGIPILHYFYPIMWENNMIVMHKKIDKCYAFGVGFIALLEILTRTYSTHFMPLSTAITLSYATPLWCAILEPIFIPGEYKYPLGRFLLGISIAFPLGWLIFHGLDNQNGAYSRSSIIKGISLSLSSALLKVLANLAIRRFIKKNGQNSQSPFVWMFSQGIVSFIGCVILFLFEQDYRITFTFNNLVLVPALLTIFLTAGGFCMVVTHDYIPVGTAVSIRVLEIPIMFFIGVFYYHDQDPSLSNFIANFVIVVFCFLTNFFLGETIDENPAPQAEKLIIFKLENI